MIQNPGQDSSSRQSAEDLINQTKPKVMIQVVISVLTNGMCVVEASPANPVMAEKAIIGGFKTLIWQQLHPGPAQQGPQIEIISG